MIKIIKKIYAWHKEFTMKCAMCDVPFGLENLRKYRSKEGVVCLDCLEIIESTEDVCPCCRQWAIKEEWDKVICRDGSRLIIECRGCGAYISVKY
jgi:RNA polymerase subunit RPABC4/transcription elongation factor Spt4